jgi:site-specific recombinase XerD
LSVRFFSGFWHLIFAVWFRVVIHGVSLYKVSQWLGHADLKTTMIYAQLQPQDDEIDRV